MVIAAVWPGEWLHWPCLDQRMTPMGSYLIPFSCFAAEALGAAICTAAQPAAMHLTGHLTDHFSLPASKGDGRPEVLLFISFWLCSFTNQQPLYENLSVIMEKTTLSCNGSLSFSCLLFAGQNGISCLCCFHVFFLLTSCSSCNCWHNS